MKKKWEISWLLATVVASILMTQFSAMAADKVVVIPLYRSGDKIPTVTSKTGRVWMDRNLGAFRVAQSKDDYQAYGWLYQWGRLADGHEVRSSPVSILNDRSNDVVPGHGNFIIVNGSPFNWLSTENNNLWQGGSGVNNPCPPGFQIPTKEDWLSEVATWEKPVSDGAFASPLRVTLAGRRSIGGAVAPGGTVAWYWTSTTMSKNAGVINFFDLLYTDVVFFIDDFRSAGASVRCIKD